MTNKKVISIMNLDIDRLSANFAKFLFLQRPMINTAMRWLSWLRFAFKQSFFQEKFEKVFPAKRNGQRWTFETKTSALPEWNVHWDECALRRISSFQRWSHLPWKSCCFFFKYILKRHFLRKHAEFENSLSKQELHKWRLIWFKVWRNRKPFL